MKLSKLMIPMLLIPLAGALFTAWPQCDTIDPLLVLPADQTCPGWTRTGEPQTAYTIEELTGIINGGAYLFELYGFVAAAFQDYAGEISGNPAILSLSAYNQGSPENAQALYHDPGSGMGDPIEDWSGSGDARMRIAFGMVVFQFWEACFFVSLVVDTGGEVAVPHTRCIAEEVVALIQGPTPVNHGSWGRIKATYQRSE